MQDLQAHYTAGQHEADGFTLGNLIRPPQRLGKFESCKCCMRDMAEQEATQISLYVGVVCHLPSGCMYSRKGMGRRETCTFLILHSGCAFTRDGTVCGKRKSVWAVSASLQTRKFHLAFPHPSASMAAPWLYAPTFFYMFALQKIQLSFSLNVILCSRCSDTQIHIANFSSFYFRTVSNFTSGGPEK